MTQTHRWMLLGPWYRPERAGHAAALRDSVPIFQKYASSHFMEEFLREPQRSLKFSDKDQVGYVVNGAGSAWPFRKKFLRMPRRKIFLDTHSRFYLVVCELHCDAPRLPAVTRDAVCQAGFVVRRRGGARPVQTKRVGSPLATGYWAKFKKSLGQRVGFQQPTRIDIGAHGDRIVAGATMTSISPSVSIVEGLGAANVADPYERPKAPSGATPFVGLPESRTYERPASAAAASEELVRLDSNDTKQTPAMNVVEVNKTQVLALSLEGWVSSDTPGIGAWKAVDETPAEVSEDIFPLYPVIPDPMAMRHTARGKTLYFGLLPVNHSDIDLEGEPRFDDRSLYEARCFVRRHKAGCPRTDKRPDCRGELIWSAATEPYQLAAHFDLDGTSHRPVTVNLPDLKALEAQTGSEPRRGDGVGVRMVSPPESNLEFGVVGGSLKAGPPGAAICSFSIPLITIVATFVLQLFLPIVVFLFGLWYLLTLKFCIPPMLNASAGAGIGADLVGALNVDISLGLDLEVSFQERFARGETFGTITNVADLKTTLKNQIQSAMGPSSISMDPFILPNPADLNVIGRVAAALATDFSAVATGEDAAAVPSAVAGLEYYDVLEATPA